MGSETSIGTMIRHLQNVKRCAEEARLVGRVVQMDRTRPPVLAVINPYVHGRSEEITCRTRDDGDWWLHWSWGEAICRADDLDAAAAAVRRVVGGDLR